MSYQIEWREYPLFDGKYLISSTGVLKNRKTGHVMRQSNNGRGYRHTILSHEGNRKTVRLHRAVALCFLSNPDNFPVVNHKDGNKLNNGVSNLEWCTHTHNIQHAYDNRLNVKPVGFEHYNSKLSKKDYEYLRDNYKPHCKVNGAMALSRTWGVPIDSVRCALRNIRAGILDT